ncbi:MAG: nucleoside deaminase [Bacilli bacterium]|nr:nucleoside deaminase [Bacilli bacterium]MDD3304648.1 nucleoside deaminase [Bacilli bacterium]MDD4053300.1 nucleoside deaminase [Bacilli bacterium]MDD4411359.1 nucleoside deaminase [Bacilli bacterium]
MEERFMKVALKQAEIAFSKGDVPVGAIIVKDNKIIAKAYNKKENTNNVTDHAEIIAIKKACKRLNDWRLNECVMYVTLEPCSMCMGAIQQSRIVKVIYGAKNTNEIDCQKPTIYGEVLENECAEMLRDFFQSKRKS